MFKEKRERGVWGGNIGRGEIEKTMEKRREKKRERKQWRTESK